MSLGETYLQWKMICGIVLIVSLLGLQLDVILVWFKLNILSMIKEKCYDREGI